MSLTKPLFSVLDHGVSGCDLILLIGGLFLTGKSTHEIHGSLEGEEGQALKKVYAGFVSVIIPPEIFCQAFFAAPFAELAKSKKMPKAALLQIIPDSA